MKTQWFVLSLLRTGAAASCPRSAEAGGAVIDRHGPSGPGHITWEDLGAGGQSFYFFKKNFLSFFFKKEKKKKDSDFHYVVFR